MYKLKTVAQRGTSFLAAVALLSGVVSSALPGVVSADELNPLTERSLMLTSSSPGFHYLDGSGNATYAPPGSGNNGQKTGETLTFKVSTDSSGAAADIKAFTLQWCTTPAGYCGGPGNNTDGDVGNSIARGPDTSSSTDLDIHYATSPTQGTGANDDFNVETWNGSAWVTNTGWTIATDNVEDLPDVDQRTGKQNFVTLVNSAGGLDIASGTQVRISLEASEDNYITNPGADAFFVKINDYSSATTLDSTTRLDGGVTVANVMNDSIQIQTKVLETMSFSVGTTNPDTLTLTNPAEHGTCDSITVNAPLNMGNPNAEDSLEVARAYDQKSYWRLSSNSSGGATVYYSGNTLSNTVGDQIDAIGTTSKISHPGSEQFGLALDSTADTLGTDMQADIDADALENPALADPHLAPHLTPLVATSEYGTGAGGINTADSGGITALFAFDPDSLTTPVSLATYAADVVTCATGKMRYVANIAATTPAGVYTSRINYIASPQY